MPSEQKVPTFRPFGEVVRGIQQIDAEDLNQQILSLHEFQVITPELWNIQITI